jgi:hypothetical protein
MDAITQNIIIAGIGLAAGLIGKIIFDWLKHTRSNSIDHKEVDNRIESLRAYLESKLEALLESVSQLQIKLAESYYTRDEGKSLEGKIDLLESRVDRLRCPVNEERIKVLERDTEQKSDK